MCFSLTSLSVPFTFTRRQKRQRPMADLRISQVLPTVKCSDCNQPVHVRQLADHICTTAPPLPSFPPPASPSPIKIDTCRSSVLCVTSRITYKVIPAPATVRHTTKSHQTKNSASPTSGKCSVFILCINRCVPVMMYHMRSTICEEVGSDGKTRAQHTKLNPYIH